MTNSKAKFKKQEDVIEYTKNSLENNTEIILDKVDKELISIKIPKSNLHIVATIKMNKDGFCPVELLFRLLDGRFNPMGPTNTSIPPRLMSGDLNDEELKIAHEALNRVLTHCADMAKKKRKEPFFILRLDESDYIQNNTQEDREKMVHRLIKGTKLVEIEQGKEKVEMYRRFRFNDQPITYDEHVLKCVFGVYAFHESDAANFFEKNIQFIQEMESIREKYPEIIFKDISVTRELFSGGHIYNQFLNVRGRLISVSFHNNEYELVLMFNGLVEIKNIIKWDNIVKVGELKLNELTKFFSQIESENRYNHLFSNTVSKVNFEMLLDAITESEYNNEIMNTQFEKLVSLTELPIEAERISAQFMHGIKESKEQTTLCDIGHFALYGLQSKEIQWYLIADKKEKDLTFIKGDKAQANETFLTLVNKFIQQTLDNI